ncbi:MAG: squalene/phytoene synthase family protein [Nitrospira sp.]|nr:squalene/phytoene synthase family protein [Nitrospira sp.]
MIDPSMVLRYKGAMLQWLGPSSPDFRQERGGEAVPVCQRGGKEVAIGHLAQPLLRDLLKRVSRLFYTTLAIVPANVRVQVGVAYLLARAADTIADTDLIERPRRLEMLNRLRDQCASESVAWNELRRIQQAVGPLQTDSAERVLLERLDEVFRLLWECSPEDRRLISKLMATLTCGMEMDLRAFPGHEAGELRAFQTFEELDRYTYHVAGCVGEFWTALMCAHRKALASWNVEHMASVGVRFGKGLQLTNIVKDVAHDLQRGRCYVPACMLAEGGLKPHDLLDPANLPRFRPVVARLVRLAVEHLDQGWLYTMAIPRYETRLRLSCMWPILSAGESLKLVLQSPDLLNPAVTVKIPRSLVYRMMALTTGTVACGYAGTAYWGYLRKQLA